VHDPAWLGVKLINNIFNLADNNATLHFTNWASGNPSNSGDRACVQLIPEVANRGKWMDEPCDKKNRVVCQRPQQWSIVQLQQAFLDVRKELNDQRKKVESLEENPVPSGFIYVQLSNQPDPRTLWPAVNWKDVTSGYAGHFFRA